jgi:large subunit ribosomal protein L25
LIRDITVEATPRDSRGKNAARRLRRQGQVPAVLYGGGKDSVPVSLSARQITQILHSATGHNTIFQIAVGPAREAAMLVDWQFDPLRGNLLHTDLKRIDLTRTLRVTVPIVTAGDARGVKTQGGLLEIVTREVELECLPSNIPDQIVVNVIELGLGEAIRAKDLAASDAYQVTTDPDRVLVHVVALRREEPKAGEAAVEVAAEAAAEPEVIKKGKQTEEEEEKGKK